MIERHQHMKDIQMCWYLNAILNIYIYIVYEQYFETSTIQIVMFCQYKGRHRIPE